MQLSVGRFWATPWIGGRLAVVVVDGEVCTVMSPCRPVSDTRGIRGFAGGLALGVDLTTLGDRPFGVYVEGMRGPDEHVSLGLGVVLR